MKHGPCILPFTLALGVGSSSYRSEESNDLAFDTPCLEDGKELWRIARDSKALELNSSYAYVLWCRDFAATSIVARSGGTPCGFVAGYSRPDEPDTVFVWQVAVDAGQRGRGVGRNMLHCLVDSRYRFLEATVCPDNVASARLFTSFARSCAAPVKRTPLFGEELFPDAHAPETLYRIGPLTGREDGDAVS
ncbi:diaminobutyrate acetyltransferase [Nonomuraea sp. B19D2]|uniref:diaminobutyrate acetyltransferase n=1 Tax=Nonomuraea sp. B19D2 TaxID=3159561 RepID=UPI0032DB4BC1